MNALELLQTAVIMALPTAADVAAKRHVVTSRDVVLLLPPRRSGEEWMAAGPYPTAEVEWDKVRPTVRVYTGGPLV